MASTAIPAHTTPRPVLPLSRRRLVGFRICLAVAAALPLLWGANAIRSAIDGGAHLLHDLIGSGVLLAVLWLTPLVAMWRPVRRPGVLLAYLATVAAAAVAALLSRSNAFIVIVLVVQAGLVTLAHPRRRRALRGPALPERSRISLPLLAIAAMQAIPLTWYATVEAAKQSGGDPHAALAHYFDQGWVALTITLLIVVAAFRPDLRRLAGYLGGFGLTAFGMVSVALPDAASSLGAVWGAAAALGGLATVVSTEHGLRPTAGATTRHPARPSR